MASNESYCLCGQQYDPSKFMILCDICKDWLHGSCVGLYEHQSVDIDKFHCPRCELMCGPSIYKVRTNSHRHDFYEKDSDSKPVQCGTAAFIRQLRSRSFENGDDGAVVRRLHGNQLSVRLLAESGWQVPLLFDQPDGLGMTLPSGQAASLSHIEHHVGSDFMVDVIDVARQRDIRMSLHDLVTYFSSTRRQEVLNCISLEFSQTSLSALVEPPYIVRKMCWVTTLWPLSLEIDGADRPQVTKYCLLSASESYTDFHIDFGGTSVWYHVLQGSKVFYLVRPTSANLALYQRWMTSPNRMSTFFGDQVDACYQLCLRAGQTLLMPSGWIHAVFTPTDSIVFGGNFLCSINAALQLRVHELETRLLTPGRFRLPSLLVCHWLGSQRLTEELTQFSAAQQRAPLQLLEAARAVLSTLRAHLRQHSQCGKRGSDPVPSCLNAPLALRQLRKALRQAEQAAPSPDTTRPSSAERSTAAAAPEPAAASVGGAWPVASLHTAHSDVTLRQSRRSVRSRRLMSDDFIDISEPQRFESLLAEAESAKKPAKRAKVFGNAASGAGALSRRVPPAGQYGGGGGNGDQEQEEEQEESGLVMADRVASVRSVSIEEPLKLRLSLGHAGARVSRRSSVSNSSSASCSPSADASSAAGSSSPSRQHCDGVLSTSAPLTPSAAANGAPLQRRHEPGRVSAVSRKQCSVRQKRLTLAAKDDHELGVDAGSDSEAGGVSQPGPPDDDFAYPSLDSSDDDYDDLEGTARLFGGGGRGRPRQSQVTAKKCRDSDELWLPKERVSPRAPHSLSNVRLASTENCSQVSSQSKKVVKPKKGMATVKQRLGKILKMHKMKF